MRSNVRWRGWLGGIIVPVILAFTVGYFVPSRTLAGDQAPRDVAPQHQTRRQSNRSALDDRVSRFAKNLDLSEAQQSAVKKILEQQQQEILKIRNDPSLAGSAGIDRVRALQEKTVEQIRAVLNEEQKKKYDPLAPRKLPPPPQPNVEDWLKTTT